MELYVHVHLRFEDDMDDINLFGVRNGRVQSKKMNKIIIILTPKTKVCE